MICKAREPQLLDEVAVAVVDCLELTLVDGNQCFQNRPSCWYIVTKQPTNSAHGLAIIFAEIGYRLEVRHQTTDPILA